MQINEQQIEDIVRGVLDSLSLGSNGSGNGAGAISGNNLNQSPGAYGGPSARGGGRIDDPQNRPAAAHPQGNPAELLALHGVFATVEEAVGAAQTAQRAWVKMPLERRKQCVEAMRRRACDNALRLAQMAVEETGLGRVADKEVKNRLCAEKTPGFEMLPLQTYLGDFGLTIDDYFPYGVICGITPVTNPTSGLINNAIIFAVAGNSAVICPHPSAKKCTLTTMALMNEAITSHGGPANMFTSVANPTIESAEATMKHPVVRLINATGGPAVVKAALAVGKKAVCAGPGNPPAIVDETADIPNAARSIVNGASFDNNLLCIGEKVTVVVQEKADALIAAMKEAGAYLVQGEEARRLADYVVQDGHINKEPIGWDAARILQRIGVNAPASTKVALLEVPANHDLVVEEQLMPVMPLVRARDFNEALEVALKAEAGRGHTLVIHSKDIMRITAVRNAYQCTVFVANGSSSAAEGINGEGFLAMSLAGHTGEGFTSPATFVKRRRAAFAGALGFTSGT
ncbi:MAG: aldehyde dehydrogenase [Abitibacteriaceae bacterium]|nr:aldehyde dehydrogenase [Abditibacteriaceae bacterium]